jgi:hypothetical protein
MELDGLVKVLLYRYVLIYPYVPDKYKKKVYRFTDDGLPKSYNSMFYNLEKYFGSKGMC